MTPMRRLADVSCLAALPCPLCGGALERGQGRKGLVWFCPDCHAGAVTLPILRQVAPRPFVNQLWQAVLRAGRASALMCPACGYPFREVANGDPRIKACLRCYWVWMDTDRIDALASTAPAPRELPSPRRRQR
jgi:Transcription factor zinc-finger